MLNIPHLSLTQIKSLKHILREAWLSQTGVRQKQSGPLEVISGLETHPNGAGWGHPLQEAGAARSPLRACSAVPAHGQEDGAGGAHVGLQTMPLVARPFLRRPGPG